MCDNGSNPDGSMRRIVPRNRHPQTIINNPPRHQHFTRAPYNYPPQNYSYNYNYSTPMTGPVPMTNNPVRMPNGGFRNVVVQQSVTNQFSVNTCMPGMEPSLQPTPPPPVLTPQPAPFPPPPPAENVGALVPLSASSVHKQTEKQEREDELVKDAQEQYTKFVDAFKACGQFAFRMGSSFINRSEKLENSIKDGKKSKATAEALQEQVKELTNKNSLLIIEKQTAEEKCEKRVQEAKNQENLWRAECVKLNARVKAMTSEKESDNKTIESLKEAVASKDGKVNELGGKLLNSQLRETQLQKEVEERDNEIESLKNKVGEKETMIKEKGLKLADLEASGEKMKEVLTQKEKSIQDLETEKNKSKKNIEKLEKKLQESCNETIKITQDLEKERRKNKANMLDLEKEKDEKIKEVNEEMKALESNHKGTIQAFQTEQDNLNSRIKKLEDTLQQKINESSKTSQELEEVRKDRQVIVNASEKKSRKIKRLKEKNIKLEKEQEEWPKKVASDILKNYAPKRAISGSSSSSEEETTPETSSMALDGDNENARNKEEQLKVQNVTPAATLGKRKYPSTGEKQREDAIATRPEHRTVSIPQISQIHFGKKPKSEVDTKIQGKGSSSRTTQSKKHK